MEVSRRRFLVGTAAALWTPDLWTPARATALSLALARAESPEGTTLATSVVRGDGPGYVPLREGPGWPTVVRTDLAQVCNQFFRHAVREKFLSWIAREVLKRQDCYGVDSRRRIRIFTEPFETCVADCCDQA